MTTFLLPFALLCLAIGWLAAHHLTRHSGFQHFNAKEFEEALECYNKVSLA